MTASVPVFPQYPAQFFVRAGEVVKGLTAQNVGATAMFASSRGAQLIPCFTPGDLSVPIAASATAYFKFRTQPRYQAFNRIWTLLGRSDANVVQQVTVAAPISGGTDRVYYAGTTRDNIAPFAYNEFLAAQSASTTTLTFKVANASGANFFIDSIGCFEAPRLNLDLSVSADGAVDLQTLSHRQPIYEATAKSLKGVSEAIVVARDAARRVGMFQHAWPIITGSELTQVFNTTSTSPIKIFETAAGTGVARTPFFLGRRMRRSSISGADVLTINVAVLGHVTGGSGDVIFTMANGATTTLNVTTSGATFGGTGAGSWTAGTIDIDTEDLAASDGLLGSTWDSCTIEARKNTSGTLYIAAISMWEGT